MLEIDNLQNDDIGPYSFSLADGECIGISGPSGAGKTRMLRLIADLDPCHGDMSLPSGSVNDMPATSWRRQVMLVPSDSHWWAETVGEHFEQADPGLLQQLGFDEAVLGWQVTRLSSGERQRLAIARALQYEPQVLLLDEPTANLDPGNTGVVEALIANYRQSGKAVIWISHDAEQLSRVADRQFLLKNTGLEEVSHAGAD